MQKVNTFVKFAIKKTATNLITAANLVDNFMNVALHVRNAYLNIKDPTIQDVNFKAKIWCAEGGNISLNHMGKMKQKIGVRNAMNGMILQKKRPKITNSEAI